MREPFLEGCARFLIHDKLRQQAVVQQHRDDEQEEPADQVNGAFEDNRAKGFLEGNVFVALQEGAAEDFSETGQGEVGQVADHHGVEHHRQAGFVVNGLEEEFRSGGTHKVRRYNCRGRKRDEKPSARVVDQRHRREDHLDIFFA